MHAYGNITEMNAHKHTLEDKNSDPFGGSLCRHKLYIYIYIYIVACVGVILVGGSLSRLRHALAGKTVRFFKKLEMIISLLDTILLVVPGLTELIS